jgi:predicted nucleic acid-binding protein
MSVIAKAVVIDASVALKWVFRDEEGIEQASQLLADSFAQRLVLHAPDLLGYEWGNGIWAALRQGRILREEALAVMSVLPMLNIHFCSFLEIKDLALELAHRYQRSYYDSAYLALAQQLNAWCFTGDKRLYNALHHQLNWLQWIGDYRWESIP